MENLELLLKNVMKNRIMQYSGKNLKKFGKNFIEIINNVVKITEILEKQYIIILWKFRRYYKVIGVEKCLNNLEKIYPVFGKILEKYV